jgi:outer membrane protein TolC
MRRAVLLGFLLAILGRTALAESITPLPDAPNPIDVLADQWQLSLPPSAARAPIGAITRDETVEHASLKQAIALALEHNPGIAARRLEPTLREADVLAAQAKFDPVLGGEAQWLRSETPNANALAGTLETLRRERQVNVGVSKLLRTGTLLSTDLFTDRVKTNVSFAQLSPELRFSLVQPLLRDFGLDFEYLVVRVAERTAAASVYDYEAALNEFVQAVIETYWNVVGARQNVEVQREALALATRTVGENEARVRVGTLAPVAVLEAQAEAKARETDLIVAENVLKTTRQRLAQLVFYRPNDTVVPRMIEPSDDVVVAPVQIDEDVALARALSDRPEVLASSLAIEARQYSERVARNSLLPRLDFVGSYGFAGLSGQNQTLRRSEIVDVATDPTTGEPFLVRRTTAIDSAFAGSERDAYERLLEGDSPSYSVGVRVEIPFSNARAKADYAATRVRREQAELRHRELLSQVMLEVRDSTAAVLDSKKAIETSRVARELAEENLRNQQKRHEVGMATTKDLLDFQTRLTEARSVEIQARVRHAIAVASWQRAQGDLLTRYQIVLEHPSRGAPWFARF